MDKEYKELDSSEVIPKHIKSFPPIFDIKTLENGLVTPELIVNLLQTHVLKSPRIKTLLTHQKRVAKAYNLIADEPSKGVFIREVLCKPLQEALGYDFTHKLLGHMEDADYFALSQKFFDDKNTIKPIFPEEVLTFDPFTLKYLKRYEIYNIFAQEQYRYFNPFTKVDIKANENDVVFDVGACLGETAYYFAKVCNVKEVHSFEPSHKAIKLCQKLINMNDIQDRVTTHELGFGENDMEATLWESDKNNCNGTSNIFPEESDKNYNYIDINTNTYNIQLMSMDSFVEQTKIIPTFIKADIEGAEHPMLLGAINTISKYKPTLAISAYHREKDIYNIPLILHKICPEYKFYLKKVDRHWETVLFATVH